MDFEALETAVKAVVMSLGASIAETCLNADDSDRRTNQIQCSCGQMAYYSGTRPRKLTTVVGDIQYKRAYYHCEQCNTGFFPKDQAMGLDSSAVSPGVVRMIGQVAGRESFAQSEILLYELAALRVSEKQVERSAERLGEDISDCERNDTELESPAQKTMYMGVDGTGVAMIKSEIKGVKGKQADGGCKTREMKVAAVWSCNRFDEHGHALTDKDSVTYTAAIETASTADTDKELAAFAKRVEREALRRGYYDAEIQVAVGDGARWIWRLYSELFPHAVQIVDVWHAKEKIWDLSKLIYGKGTDTGKQWAEKTIEILKAGEIEKLIEIIQPHSSKHAEVKTAVGYFSRNKKRMRYAEFRARGLSISSAVVEGACKNVIGARLKRSGMRWSKAGANKIAALRACIISNRFADFLYKRASNS